MQLDSTGYISTASVSIVDIFIAIVVVSCRHARHPRFLGFLSVKAECHSQRNLTGTSGSCHLRQAQPRKHHDDTGDSGRSGQGMSDMPSSLADQRRGTHRTRPPSSV
jgi:hypothetical protein